MYMPTASAVLNNAGRGPTSALADSWIRDNNSHLFRDLYLFPYTYLGGVPGSVAYPDRSLEKYREKTTIC